MRIVLVLMVTAACVEPGTTRCEDGGTCPAGTVCTADGRCASPEQLASCNGVSDGGACSYLGVPDGACSAGACVPAGCGNGVIEPLRGETCDDGNVIPLDMCAADCTSDERCGNGVIDVSKSELCDDGNATSLDGCASTCRIELASWATLTPGPPSARWFHPMTYDSTRQRVVLFGGNSNGHVDDTWEWDGARWLVVPTTIQPGPRFGHALAYDAERRRVVLFGGKANNSDLNDTWEYDGVRWVEILPVGAAPVPRWLHTMAYDSRLGRVVMFGGERSGTLFDETWTWDGIRWELIAGGPLTVPAPSARDSSAMAFDPASDHIVLFGGRAGGELGDTWILDATGWHQVTGAGGAIARWNHELVFDAARGVVVMSGGAVGNLPIVNDAQELLQWTGSAWTAVPSLNADWPGLEGHAVAYHVAARQLVAFGGKAAAGTVSDTWLWNLSAGWRRAPTSPRPPPRSNAAMTWDSRRARAVMYGGDGSLTDTWEWDGGQWHACPDGPVAGTGYRMAYDAARSVTVAFGGGTNTTWLWNGIAWSTASPAQRPPSRTGGSLAYDPIAQVVVLFGGSEIAGAALGDTWLWNGVTWQQVSGPGPSARDGHAMAYDPIRKRIVLFGGAVLANQRGDTWLWDGASWTDATPSVSPLPRTGHQLVFHQARQRIQTIGGVPNADLFEWDGASWSRPPVFSTALARRANATAVYIPEQGTIEFGGRSPTSVDLNDVIRLRWESDSPVDVCAAAVDLDGDDRTGCLDPDCDAACEHCGDGVCNAATETCALCPGDCGTCPVTCGDFHCDGNESLSCPGDC